MAPSLARCRVKSIPGIELNGESIPSIDLSIDLFFLSQSWIGLISCICGKNKK